MIHRALIHVAGPAEASKTTLIEWLLEKRLAFATCIRGERVAGLRREEESGPRRHPELRRYRELGASAVALYRFPRRDTETFYDSDVMREYSEAVFIEGDCPVDYVDLSIFVAPAPRPGESSGPRPHRPASRLGRTLRRGVRDPRDAGELLGEGRGRGAGHSGSRAPGDDGRSPRVDEARPREGAPGATAGRRRAPGSS